MTDIEIAKQVELKNILEIAKECGLTEDDIQVLAPMYKGENGIDNLNILLQGIFNPKDEDKKDEDLENEEKQKKIKKAAKEIKKNKKNK